MTNILLQHTELSANAAKCIRKVLAANNYTLVETNEDADFVLEVRMAGEGSTHRIDDASRIVDGGIAHNTLRTSVEGSMSAANLVTGIQSISGNLELKTGDISQVVSHESEQLQELKKQLNDLLIQFHGAVQRLPDEYAENAEMLAKIGRETTQEVGKAQPGRKMLEIKANDLLEAAKGVASVTPLVLTIAQQIAAVLLRYMPQ